MSGHGACHCLQQHPPLGDEKAAKMGTKASAALDLRLCGHAGRF